MPSESSNSPAPAIERIMTVQPEMRLRAYIRAFGPVIGTAFSIGGSMKSPEHRTLSHNEIFLLLLMLCPFAAWALFVLHRAVARIEIDELYISTFSLLGTRRSVALRDITSDMVILGAESHKYLELKTMRGTRLKIPDFLFSEDRLCELREDLAGRVRRATGLDIPTRKPPAPDRWVACLVIVLLPLAALIVVKAAQAIRMLWH